MNTKPEIPKENEPPRAAWVFPKPPTAAEKKAFIKAYEKAPSATPTKKKNKTISFPFEDIEGNQYFKSVIPQQLRAKAAQLLFDYCLDNNGIKESYEALAKQPDALKMVQPDALEMVQDAASFLNQTSRYKDPKNGTKEETAARDFHHVLGDYLVMKWNAYQNEQRTRADLTPKESSASKKQRSIEELTFDRSLFMKKINPDDENSKAEPILESSFCRDILYKMNESILVTQVKKAKKTVAERNEYSRNKQDDINDAAQSAIIFALTERMTSYLPLSHFSSYLSNSTRVMIPYLQADIMNNSKADNFHASAYSLDAPLEQSANANKPTSIAMLLNDEIGEDDTRSKLELLDVKIKIGSILKAQEVEVISRRYNLNNAPPQTPEEIGKDLGLDKDYVKQIQSRAIRKLRKAFGVTPEGRE